MSLITPYHQSCEFTWPLSIADKIMIFEEQVLGWQLYIAEACLNGRDIQGEHYGPIKDSGFAALSISISYFEFSAKTKAGYTGDGKSMHYFSKGVRDVFPELEQLTEVNLDELLRILYKSVRCGLYHAGSAAGRVVISGDYTAPVTYDPENRRLRINPHLLVPVLHRHFLRYIETLRDSPHSDLRHRFERRFDHIQSFDPLTGESCKHSSSCGQKP